MSRILCIEDETEIREFLVETLVEAGYDVASADNGHDGLTLISSYAPDLIVSDLFMPLMSGLELLNIVRNDYPRFADVPFILLTGHTDRDAVLKGLASGADDYLLKPVDINHLLAKVAAMLRQVSRMHDKKRTEHIKLYKALTRLAEDVERSDDDLLELVGEVVRADDGSTESQASVCLIGREETSVNGLKAQLEQSGLAVTHFTGGREFLDRINSLSPVAVLINFFTDDIQGNLVARFAKKKKTPLGYPLVLLWPSEAGRVPQKVRDEQAIDDFVILPALDLEERIDVWKKGIQNISVEQEASGHV